MKKTLNINLNGQVFNIDEDAYNLLEVYLKNLQNYFRKEQGQDEIISDFESRIEEILSQKISKGASNVISIADVENVIKLVGSPSDFDEENSAENTDDKQFNAEPEPQATTKHRKKFYRNPNDKMLGGVCSGLAAFFGVDATIVRIILFILLIFFGTGICLYIILWLIVPEAKTAEQQLEMTGEEINLENIGKVLSDNTKSMGNDVKTAYQKVNNSGCLSTFLKVCVIGLGILVGLPILFALVVVILVLIAVLFGIGTGFIGEYMPYTPDTIALFYYPSMAAVGTCLLIGIPLISILYTIVSAVFKWKPVYKWAKITALVLWVGSFVLIGCSGLNWKELKNKHFNDCYIGFSKESFDYYITGDRNMITQTKTFSGLINEIEMHNGISIDLQIDSTATKNSGMTITGDSNIISEYIRIEQESNRLVIKAKTNRTNLVQSKNYLVKLQTSNLNNVDLSGASKIYIDKWKNSGIVIDIRGASRFNVSDIQADTLDIEISGASNAKLTGKAYKANIELSGASRLSAFDLSLKYADVDVRGASTLKCCVEKELSGEASGASSVIYSDSPNPLTLKCTGASNMRKK